LFKFGKYYASFDPFLVFLYSELILGLINFFEIPESKGELVINPKIPEVPKSFLGRIYKLVLDA